MGRQRKDLDNRPDIVLALGKVESDKIELRLNGLLELRRIINDNRYSSKLKHIDDKGYHAILETVFRVAKIDISALARASKYTASKISNRLAACGSLVRTIVDVGLVKFRHKTVKALVEHISQCLPTADASYCEPLIVDYFKALGTLLGYRAHVEHLSSDDWHELLDFCVNTARDLNKYEHSDNRNASNLQSSHSSRSKRAATSTTTVEHSHSFSNHESQRLSYPQLQGSNEDILLCISHMTIVPNAPVADKAEPILDVMLDLLTTYPHLSKIQQNLYETIDSVLSRIIISHISLSLRTVGALIPLVRKTWQRATPNQRELMLSVLLRGESLFHSLIRSEGGDSITSLGVLLDAIKMQYCSRKPREQLQIDDLEFSNMNILSSQHAPLAIRAMRLRTGAIKAEDSWCVIHISSTIYAILEEIATKNACLEEDDFRASSKRQKRSSPVDELLECLRGSDLPYKVYSLQVIAMLFEQVSFEDSILHDMTDLLISHISQDDSTVVSWAIVAVASLASQVNHSTDLVAFWPHIWRLLFRHMATSSLCRVACQTLAIILEQGLVTWSDVADLVNSMLSSSELNGPSLCDDGSTRLWVTLLWLKQRENLIVDIEMSSTILRWFYRCWNPARLHDRTHIAYIAHNASILQTTRLICLCLGISPPIAESPSLSCLGRLSQTRLETVRNLELGQYLLQQPWKIHLQEPPRMQFETTMQQSCLVDGAHRVPASILMDFLIQETSTICSSILTASSTVRSNAMNIDLINVILQLGIIGFSLLSGPFAYDAQHRYLLSLLERLREGLKAFFLEHEKRQDFVNAFFDTTGPIFGYVSNSSNIDDLLAHGIICMSQGLDQKVWKVAQVDTSKANGYHDELDAMDTDIEYNPQTQQQNDLNIGETAIHKNIEATTSIDAYRTSVATKIFYSSSLNISLHDGRSTERKGLSILIDYLTSLKGRDFLLNQVTLHDIFASNRCLSADDADTLLQYIQQVVVKLYELEGSEVSICICIDALASMAPLWTLNDGGDIAVTGAELYVWFMNKVFGKGYSSPNVLSSAANLLLQVIKVCPDYAKGLSLASARTTLLRVLGDGGPLVKYGIGNHIPAIFGLFILKEHPTILEDIIDSLPSDPDWIEGIALRIYILGKLAPAWPTLLRRCVYAIFETVGHVQGSRGYGRLVLDHMAKDLKLSSSKELFKMFAPQLLYTWLETQSVGSIPFNAFGYASLKDLLLDVREEVVGQIMMRDKNEDMGRLTAILDTPFEHLLALAFSKAATYSIARDIAIPPPHGSQASQAEPRLRRLLGKEKYATLVMQHFAEIVTLFFLTADYEDQIQRAFQRNPACSKAYTAYQKIVSISTSDQTLPPNQQPSFKTKYLIAELEHLCGRTSYDIESLWTHPLYVYIFRKIMNSIHSALGSLHACSVLRKLRILICMAGQVALEAYPLEMALQSLRPFLNDALCADDAIGLVQYLLEHGAAYLKEAPTLLLSHAITTLVSMKKFLSSSQDSTTQESHFKTTISRARSYHDWLIRYLIAYKSPTLSVQAAAGFQAITRAAGSIREGDCAKQGTHEGDLLLAFLEDERYGRKLLSRASRNFLLRSLSESFELPKNFHDDVLGGDAQATQYASTVWNTCRWSSAGNRYLVWGGRVLGRAYASQGLIDTSMIHETSLDSGFVDNSKSAYRALSQSRGQLLRLLSNLLMRDSSQEIGLVEGALSYIVTESHLTDHATECERCLEQSVYKASLCLQYEMPTIGTRPLNRLERAKLLEFDVPNKGETAQEWIKGLAEALTYVPLDDPLMVGLSRILSEIEGLAEDAFPFILHLVLSKEVGHNESVKPQISTLCRRVFELSVNHKANRSALKILLNTILYLRTQPFPNEVTRTDRAHWLDLDLRQVAQAASQCAMYKTALMFLELEDSEKTKSEAGSRRRSKNRPETAEPPNQLLLEIYQHIDEQDAFYGVKQSSNLLSIMSRLEYEHAGFKGLSFRSAFYDSQIRQTNDDISVDREGMVQALNDMDLNGLSQPWISKIMGSGPRSIDAALRTARKLEQWDISPPNSCRSNASTIFEVFRKISHASDAHQITAALDIGFTDSMQRLLADESDKSSLRPTLSSLAILTEAEEIFSSRNFNQLKEVFSRFSTRNELLRAQSYDTIKDIISCRETAFSCLSKRSPLQELLKVHLCEAQLLECRLLLASSAMSRGYGALQNSLSTTMHLNQLIEPYKAAGVNVTAAAQFESSQVLWSQGEMTASVQLLKELSHNLRTDSLGPQSIPVGISEMLAKLGHHTAEARLQKPEIIIQNMLKMAVKELNDVTTGDEAGEVYHEFAYFCDQQLQNPDSLADFRRIQKLRERKEAEVRDLDRMITNAGSQTKEKENLKSHRNRAQQWFELDDGEYQRLDSSRLTLVKYSLENYLLCLQASDRYDTDALRFSALWLENNENEVANEAVARHMPLVPSRKFAPLMNQWTSRLLDEPGKFQSLLFGIIQRICIDHPYHGMYQIFASSKTKGGKDETALARHAAANSIVERLKTSAVAQKTWIAVHNTNVTFVRFAQERLEDSSTKPGSKVPLRKIETGRRVEQDVLKMRVPPPTMTVELRADCNYDAIVMIAKFQPEFTIAGGISMPKIVTALGTDGLKYKQLFKGGNDDLRQDAIMEQVFGAVSSLLKAQRPTRQRNLKIRTYKVLPLTATAGVIEFVPDTIPLHEYLLPAHQRHFPKDLKPNNCRKHIQEAQTTSTDNRIKVFHKVCEQFHPVLRYFFQERFDSPDDWFDKRLAYTRSTAAISILGHILGLGDRHGHNILLDEKTGEVVHIDLGIAFEQGRVLPVPEVVPFRLTRDLIDGMGITGVEGVFRRCCEFTLEALRNESYSIMTILDVLRYDPLYSWSLSPLRLKKMQEAQTEDPGLPGEGGEGNGKKVEEDAGEADRALLVVGKKLSRTLSVQATVNELIYQATDEKNLAVLFCGWAAYA